MEHLPFDKLETLHRQAWQQLTNAALQADHVMHYLSLSTIDQQGQPQARFLVLRTVDPPTATLEFHTDIRSSKWAELQKNSALSVLGYDPAKRLQLRFNGRATLHGHNSTHNQQAWQQLSGWTRHSYCGGPPGDELNAPETAGLLTEPPDDTTTAKGRKVFGVISFQAVQLDWFHHPRAALRRALFDYKADGSMQSARWIRP